MLTPFVLKKNSLRKSLRVTTIPTSRHWVRKVEGLSDIKETETTRNLISRQFGLISLDLSSISRNLTCITI